MLDTISSSSNQPPSRLEGRVVLFGLADPQADMWIEAATACSLACLRVASFEACATLGSEPIPTTMLVSSQVFDPTMVSRTDPRFRRTTLIVCDAEASHLPLWKLIGWGAIASGENLGRIGSMLVDAHTEATKRTRDWVTYELFKSRLATLSADETRVFEAVCKGRLNKQMASDLGVSIRTIEQRRRRLFNKMQVESAVPLAAVTAQVQAIDDLIARERTREHRLQPILPIPMSTEPSEPVTVEKPVPKPKFYAGFHADDPSLVTPNY